MAADFFRGQQGCQRCDPSGQYHYYRTQQHSQWYSVSWWLWPSKFQQVSWISNINKHISLVSLCPILYAHWFYCVYNSFIYLCNRSSEFRTDNVHLLSDSQDSDCKPPHDGGVLIFYAPPTTFLNSTYQISSRQVVIGPLNVADVEFDAIPSHAEVAVLSNIQKDENLSKIFNLVRYAGIKI